MNPNICSVCREMKSEALRCPLVSDLPALKNGAIDRTRHPFKEKVDDAHEYTALSSFGEILERGSKCSTCQIIGDSLSRKTLRCPDPEDQCEAYTSYFAAYRDRNGKKCWVCRLSICVVAELEKYLWDVFQACSIGESSVEADPDRCFQDTCPGALSATPLPQTIQDAIHVTKSLGFRHLWVDTLCIMQDDVVDKEMQIAAMSLIYGSAFLTITAASSSSVRGGVQGVQPGSRFAEQEEMAVIPKGATGHTDVGLSLMTCLHPLHRSGDHVLSHTLE
ncbi:hypothetical protein B0T14DRAFT_570370 [Immersiella caudata]|uniref:Heterokaryon incompatibility domain-containing protein n=1 Tax=Immersiella caudata TaxID=314043 RepID=A0AA40BUV4_9PEZI|nr:hypothetical protein B0T14DRAFT_570370 [Immersiella caudata]